MSGKPLKSLLGFTPLSIFLIFTSATFLALGCASKAEPREGTGFIRMDLMTKPQELPFHKAWRKPGLDWGRYSEIFIAPVNTEYLLQMEWWEEGGPKNEALEDINELARYTEETFKEAFHKDPEQRYQAAEAPGPQALILEFALVEVTPNKAFLEAASYAAGPAFKLIGSIAGSVIRSKSQSTVAFEARLRDGASGEILALFADREAEKQSLVNVKSLSWYAHAKSIIAEWADQFVKITHLKEGEILEDSKAFELKPW